MTIDDVIRLWNKSKYDRLLLINKPCINHEGDIIEPMAFFTKGQIIMCGGNYDVEDYLRIIYKDHIFIFCDIKDYISFKVIISR